MMFIISKLFTFFVSGSATLLVMFYIGRSGQMKPTAAQLEKNPTNWESKGCCSSQAPCELWNKYHGKEKFFQDLPLQPPDYDLSMCCVAISTRGPILNYRTPGLTRKRAQRLLRGMFLRRPRCRVKCNCRLRRMGALIPVKCKCKSQSATCLMAGRRATTRTERSIIRIT